MCSPTPRPGHSVRVVRTSAHGCFLRKDRDTTASLPLDAAIPRCRRPSLAPDGTHPMTEDPQILVASPAAHVVTWREVFIALWHVRGSGADVQRVYAAQRAFAQRI